MTMLKSVWGQRRLRYLFGISLCSLLFFFAIAAKLAVYHPDQAGAPISAAKMWQDSPEPAVEIAANLPAPPPLLSLFVLVIGVAFVAARWMAAAEYPSAPLQAWLPPQLSVRPPPSR